MAEPLKVALLMGRAIGYSRNVLRGIMRFAERRRWICRYADPTVHPIETIQQWKPDGIIAHLNRPELAERVLAMGAPVVNVSASLKDVSAARVGVDCFGVGELAAEHLLERGFRHFAFIGYNDRNYSMERLEGFVRALRAMGYKAAWYFEEAAEAEQRGHASWAETSERMRQWVGALPRPVGIMAGTDFLGLQVIEVCRQAKLRIPDDIALVGVDDDDLLCELAHPALSSVKVPAERVGHEAAALLEKLMAGGAAPEKPILLPPIGVVARASSDVLALEDPELASAVRFIRGHAGEPIGVEDVLRRLSVSRRSLERRFREALQRSPLDEIRRMRMENAKVLLAETDLPLATISRQCGFTGAQWLSTVFRKATGMLPTEYRKQFRG